MDETWLPSLLDYSNFGGRWEDYLEAAYSLFHNQFVTSKPVFCGHAVSLKRYPIVNGKEATFWHFVQEGEIEDDRIPDFRRIERLPWIRAVIEAAGKRTDLNTWDQVRRKGERRIAIALEDFSYLVVLAERQRQDLSVYHLPWTAYPIARQHQREKLRRQYESAGPCVVRGVALKS